MEGRQTKQSREVILVYNGGLLSANIPSGLISWISEILFGHGLGTWNFFTSTITCSIKLFWIPVSFHEIPIWRQPWKFIKMLIRKVGLDKILILIISTWISYDYLYCVDWNGVFVFEILNEDSKSAPTSFVHVKWISIFIKTLQSVSN